MFEGVAVGQWDSGTVSFIGIPTPELYLYIYIYLYI